MRDRLGAINKRMGYLYEWLTQRDLKIEGIAGGNYIDLLDPERYITGKVVKNARWRMNDNLIGVSE